LTTAPFAELAEASPWFDEVRLDARPAGWNLHGLLRLRRQLRGFDFVYDLQTSGRSSRYFWLAGRPGWSGIARGASHLHANPARNTMHTIERQRDQLRVAGITAFPHPDLSWLTRGDNQFGLPDRFALLVPGAAPHRPAKRWPVQNFAALARRVQALGMAPVVIGAAGDRALGEAIRNACPATIDLTGRTRVIDIGTIASRAALAVGNDTGPMHLAAAVGCRSLVLFSHDSDPALTAPRGEVTVLRAPNLADLPVERVAAALS
jgi:ADP-heptose:LPS heptosyltransferase